MWSTSAHKAVYKTYLLVSCLLIFFYISNPNHKQR